MPRKFYAKPKKNYAPQPTDAPFRSLAVMVPRSIFEILRAESEETGIAMSRLACIALDNELDVESPFNYPCAMPENPYVEGGFAAEANRIYHLIEKMDGPTTLESLMLSRREVDLIDRRTFMQGYRELLESGLIEEVKPRRLKPGQTADFRLVQIASRASRIEHSNRLQTPKEIKDDKADSDTSRT